MISTSPQSRVLSSTGLRILFAHPAYRLADRFALRATGIDHSQVSTLDDLRARIGDADVLVVSGLWRNDLIPLAPKLVGALAAVIW